MDFNISKIEAPRIPRDGLERLQDGIWVGAALLGLAIGACVGLGVLIGRQLGH